MLLRDLEHDIPVKLRINVQSKFYDEDGGNAYNVIAELPGSDPALRDEVVMIGGHLDSWHTGVGATDNADGVTTVFYETLVSDKTAKTIAADAGLKTDVLDPIEGITSKSRGKDYFSVQEANLKALQTALGAK